MVVDEHNQYDSRRYAMVNRWDPRHLERIRRRIEIGPGRRILEVGCGVGHLTKRLRALGADAVGIDVNPNASELAVTAGVSTMRAEALDFADDAFDGIVSVHAIEHIPDLEGALSEMARVLRPGGDAVFIYPAEPIKGIWAVPTAVIIHRNPLKAQDIHCQWLWPSKVRRLTEVRGFDHVSSEFNLIASPQFVTHLRRR